MKRLRQVGGAGGLIGPGPAAKQLQRLGLGRGGEGEVADARVLPGARGHVGGQDVLVAHLAAIGQRLLLFAAEHLLELGRRLARLAGMRLVGNHGKALALRGRQLAHRRQRERKGLDGADHDLLVARQRLRQLLALAGIVAGDAGHHAGGALKVVDRLLQLRVQHVAVAHHQHAGKHLAVLRVVQLAQKVRRPGNRVGLARARAVLDQIPVPRPLGQHRLHQLACGVQLVVAREQHRLHLLLRVAPRHQIAADDLQPAVALPHLLPQVGRAVPLAVGWVARAAAVALVEGQKPRGRAQQARRHEHRAVAHRKVHQRAARKVEQRLGLRPALGARQALEAVLVDGPVHVLGEVGLQLGRGHGHAVQAQHQVDDVVVVRAHLAQHAQAVGRVARL